MVVVIERDGEKVCETRLCVLALKSERYSRDRSISSPLPLPYLSNTFPPGSFIPSLQNVPNASDNGMSRKTQNTHRWCVIMYSKKFSSRAALPLPLAAADLRLGCGIVCGGGSEEGGGDWSEPAGGKLHSSTTGKENNDDDEACVVCLKAWVERRVSVASCVWLVLGLRASAD